jgi:hypothetical protein
MEHQAMSTTINRRTILAGTTAALATATGANSAALATHRLAEPDPIFAAIAEHHAAIKRYTGAISRKAKIESMLIDELRAAGAENPVADADDDPRYRAAADVVDETGEEQSDAMDALLEVAPTTMAGVAALLRHVEQTAIAEDWFLDPVTTPWIIELFGRSADALQEMEART